MKNAWSRTFPVIKDARTFLILTVMTPFSQKTFLESFELLFNIKILISSVKLCWQLAILPPAVNCLPLSSH